MADPREEMIAKANGLYLSLVGLTANPAEAMNILCIIHLLLFLNHGDPSATVDDMLTDYCKNFRKNWKANKTNAQ